MTIKNQQERTIFYKWQKCLKAEAKNLDILTDALRTGNRKISNKLRR